MTKQEQWEQLTIEAMCHNPYTINEITERLIGRTSSDVNNVKVRVQVVLAMGRLMRNGEICHSEEVGKFHRMPRNEISLSNKHLIYNPF